MINDYVRMVHSAMQNREEDIIMVHKNRLSDEDISLIEELTEIYDKTVVFGSLQEILNNKDKNVYVVE
jgi:hypothetical protein